MYVGIWSLRRLSDRAVQGFSIQSGYAIVVHISVNVLRRVAAKLAVLSVINVIIWPFSILSRIRIVGVVIAHIKVNIDKHYLHTTPTCDWTCFLAFFL